MNLLQAENYLNSFINYEKVPVACGSSHFRLERMQAVLDLIENPQNHLKIIHVAGSKGKGSVCAYVAHILKQAGYSVGLYTSPHILDVKERIRLLNDNRNFEEGIFPDAITVEEFCLNLEEIKPFLDKVHHSQAHGQLTYFEVLTILSFYFFNKSKVDFAILETGLGGRLDATNIVNSLICGITPIDYEHTDILGETLKEIAKEKASIIKNSTLSVVISPQKQESLDVLLSVCHEKNIKPCLVGNDINIERKYQNRKLQRFDVYGYHDKYHVKAHLLGEHQAANAATAIGLIEALDDAHITQEDIQGGISKTLWPGRMEILNQHPTVIIDCAHSPDSIKALFKTVQEVFPDKKIYFILGMSLDKKVDVLLKDIKDAACEMIFTSANHPRARKFSKSEIESFNVYQPYNIIENTQDALSYALDKARDEDIVLAAGSVFVMSEIRKYWQQYLIEKYPIHA